MPRPRLIRRMRKKIGTALENWSKRRVARTVQKLEQRAAEKYTDADLGEMRIENIFNEPDWGRFQKSNLSAINLQRQKNEDAIRLAQRLRDKAARIKRRHTTGWIGKTIRKIKGK